jgi:hypothetical protein
MIHEHILIYCLEFDLPPVFDELGARLLMSLTAPSGPYIYILEYLN